MQQTLEGNGSELADTLKFVDEQMLVGMPDNQKQVLRPLLVRPLVQTFAMIVIPVEAEINKTWELQVAEPFQRSLAAKAPFSPGAPEASAAEIGALFGPEGQIAKFVSASMGTLVVRRGDVLAPRTWAELGITLTPAALAGFPRWIAPLNQNGAPREPQTVFQLQGVPASELLEYAIEVDGQQMRYRNNSAPVWTNIVHPGPGPGSGARIVATGMDGRVVEVFNEPGPNGLKRMIDGAVSRRMNNDVYELRWARGSTTLAVDLKIIATPDAPSGDGGRSPFRGLRLPHNIVGRSP
jgi:type VI secretion system protein ImpL